MSPDLADLFVEQTRALSDARAKAHHYRELLLMALELDGATQRENRVLNRRLDALLTLRRGERLDRDV